MGSKMSDEIVPKRHEYLPPEKYSLGGDPLPVPDPNAGLSFIDRILSDWRLRKSEESWRRHAANLEAMRAAFIAKRIAIDEVIEYLKAVERFSQVKEIRRVARDEAKKDIAEGQEERRHERDMAAERRQAELAEAKRKRILAEKGLSNLENQATKEAGVKRAKERDPLADFRSKLTTRQKIEAECDRLVEELRAKARARGKAEDDPDLRREIDNLMDHALRAIEETYE